MDKDQLIYLIDQYEHTIFQISETLVDESKWHIEPQTAIEKIRETLQKNQFSLRDEHLGDYINMRQGKITEEEWRKIILGEE